MGTMANAVNIPLSNTSQTMITSFIPNKNQRQKIWISETLTSQYLERIEETIKDSEMLFYYLSHTIELQINDGFAKIYNNKLIIINPDLRNKTSGNKLYAIIQPNNGQSNQDKYKWRMVELSE